MASTWNAAIVTENLLDDAEASASSAAENMPAALLISSPHVTDDRWRSTASSASIVFATPAGGVIGPFDTIAALGMTMGPAGTLRCRVSSVDPTGAAGDLFDSSVLADGDDPAFSIAYQAGVFLLDAPVSGYIRFDLVDASAAYVEMGKAVAGLRTQLAYNFAPGGTFDWTDLSASKRSRGGQTQVWQQASFRSASLSFDWVSNTDRWGIVETLGRQSGMHSAVLLILKPDADNLPQWTIWGLAADQTPAAFQADDTLFQKQIHIVERL